MKENIELRKTTHKDLNAWAVKKDGTHIGFIIEGRSDWSFCATRRTTLPRSWMSCPQPTQEAAIAKLEQWDEQNMAVAKKIIDSVNAGNTIVEL